MLREAEVARAVHAAAAYLAPGRSSIGLAGAERAAAEAARTDAEAALAEARAGGAYAHAGLRVAGRRVHRDEMARAEQRMRLETLTEKAMAELGLEPEALVPTTDPISRFRC